MIYQGKHLSVKPLENKLVELVFDVQDSPVNLFHHETVVELSAALDALYSKSSIQGLLISSAKTAFFAGADIKEFVPVFNKGAVAIATLLRNSNANFNRLEDAPFPVVAAIKGFCLGGGFELALACDYRLGTKDARLGLPETRLGIIPGWGGTVRLPRLIGVEGALEWITTGKQYPAYEALKAGAIDGVIEDDLHQAAVNTLQRCVRGELDWQPRRLQKQSPLRHNTTEKSLAFASSMAMVRQQAGKHYPAPIKVVETLEKAASCDRTAALACEEQAFIALTQTSQAHALIGHFLSDQSLSKCIKGWAKQAEKRVERAAVLGAGIMGGGIAYQSALKNIPIVMKDIQQAGLDAGISEANALLSKRVAKGRMATDEIGRVLSRINPTLSYQGFDSVDIVVEAVIENADIKQAVLVETEAQVSEDSILCSNTSTISIDLLSKPLKRPQNFCGMHFFQSRACHAPGGGNSR